MCTKRKIIKYVTYAFFAFFVISGCSQNTRSYRVLILPIVEDISGNKDGKPATAKQINAIDGVSGARDGVDYSKALEEAEYENRAYPTPQELQRVIDSVNAKLDDFSQNDENETTLSDSNNTESNVTISVDENTTDLNNSNAVDENITESNTTNPSDGNNTESNVTISVDENTTDLNNSNAVDENITESNTTNPSDGNNTENNTTISIDENSTDENTTTPQEPFLDLLATPKEKTNIYEHYSVKVDINSSSNTDVSLKNAPSWLEFNATSGYVEGMPLSEGNYTDIELKVSSEDNISKTITFSIEVAPARNIALAYAIATQAPDEQYTYFEPASNVIDGDLTNYSHTRDSADKNWLQLAFPKDTEIKKVVIYNRERSTRTIGAKLYICNQKIDGNLSKIASSCQEVKTLSRDARQIWDNDANLTGDYLFVKNNNNTILNLSEIEAYGILSPKFVIRNDDDISLIRHRIVPQEPFYTIETIGMRNDALTFSIEENENFAVDENGNLYAKRRLAQKDYNLTVHASDGVDTATEDLNISVVIEFAHEYGKATQGAKPNYSFYRDPINMIDDNRTSRNGSGSINKEIEQGIAKNWIQVELPQGIKVENIKIKGIYRIEDAKVYFLEKPQANYSDLNVSLDVNDEVATLVKTNQLQSIDVDINSDNKRFLLIKAKGDTAIELFTVEVYGVPTETPVFTNNEFNTTIDRWQGKTKSIFKVDALDYQHDTIDYSIEGNMPFVIDQEGNIRVNDVLDAGTYTFNVILSDGSNQQSMPITIEVVETPLVFKPQKVQNGSPLLTGLIPNVYNDGDSFTININGSTYTPTIGADGNWTIDKGIISPKLDEGFYDITLNIDGVSIHYADYFEVHGLSLLKHNESFVMETIGDVDVEILSQNNPPLPTGKKIRGSSIWLYDNNGTLTLQNDSFRVIGSIIGRYKDANDKYIYKRLKFSQNILPYSTNVLQPFENSDKMEIYVTAKSMDVEYSFNEHKGPEGNCSGREYEIEAGKKRFCTPTTRFEEPYSRFSIERDELREPPYLSEQQMFTVIIAAFHHMYNTVDAIPAMKAWMNAEFYDGMDFTGYYQGFHAFKKDFDDNNFTKESYLNYHTMYLIMPNKHTRISSIRYWYPAEGLATGHHRLDLYGQRSSSGYASLWEGSIVEKSPAYEYVIHEIDHSIGFGHEQGLTYGWPTHIRTLVEERYGVGVHPVSQAPKYFFDMSKKSRTEAQLTLYKTEDANDNELTFEIFSAKRLIEGEVVMERQDDDAANQTTLKLKDESLYTRLIVRVYGDDSYQVATKIVPYTFFLDGPIAEDSKAKYYTLAKRDWLSPYRVRKTLQDKFSSGSVSPFYDINKSIMTVDRAKLAKEACRAVYGENARLVHIQEIDTLSGIGSAIKTKVPNNTVFVGYEDSWRNIYLLDYTESNTTYVRTKIHDYEKPLPEGNYHLMCRVPK